MSFSIEYHLFLNLSITFLFGNVIRKKKGISLQNSSWDENIVPFAIIYLPFSLFYAFIVNELPLTGISIDPIYDSNTASSLGPQSISRDALLSLVIIIASFIINIIVWLYTIVIIVKYYNRIRITRNFKKRNS